MHPKSLQNLVFIYVDLVETWTSLTLNIEMLSDINKLFCFFFFLKKGLAATHNLRISQNIQVTFHINDMLNKNILDH